MSDGDNWKIMFDKLWETHEETVETSELLYKSWVVCAVKLQLLEKYAEKNPTVETCEMLDIIRIPDNYEEAKDKLKALQGDIDYGIEEVSKPYGVEE